MSRSYARNRSSRSHSAAQGKFLVALASFLSGYLVATVFDMASLTTWVNKTLLNHDKTAPAHQVAVKHHEQPKPKFEFYTLLSKETGIPATANTHPQAAAPRPAASPPASNTIPSTAVLQSAAQHATQAVVVAESKPVQPIAKVNPARETWQIQIASFNRRKDAEHLKASLVMRGFDVSITPVSQRNMTWYRVIVGPFASRESATKAQVIVARSERMKGMIRKVEG